MSKLYEALKRLDKNNNIKPAQFIKKPQKSNIKWFVLFFASIIVGTLLLHLSNIIGTNTPKSLEKPQNITISKVQNSTNATHTQNNTASIEQSKVQKTQAHLKSNSQPNPNPNPNPQKSNATSIANSSLYIPHQNSNSTIKDTTVELSKQKQLKNVISYQEEKGAILANLALEINQSIEQNDFYRVKLLLKKYLSIQEDPFALNDLAGIYIKEGKYNQAISLLNKSIEIKPSAAAYINLIYCYKKLNELEKINNMLKTINPAMFSEQQKAIINSIISSH